MKTSGELILMGGIADEKEFEDVRQNPMYMGGEGHAEVEHQAGKLIEISNSEIYAMKEEDLYHEILQILVKQNKSTDEKSPKKRFKVAIQNRVRNVTMAEAIKNALENFPETATWNSLRTIDIPVMDPQNKFAVDREPTAPDDS